ncbi:zinc ribbon domain-containing protein [Methanolobus bombayensis]|uniref:zinc ribbon domain-containing protein n=1 Tax=Methanolobus bombayensis TaxID=38023 RepID=UPI001AEA25DD|nr:zinc ribbon domain-containing protein [Methanolobus bombayensis]MBP1909064.1 hypothetical protein [Methanolobus bombayensis]
MSLKLSYFDPRNNLLIGVYIGFLLGLTRGFPNAIGGAIIGLILAFVTAYIVQGSLNKKIEKENYYGADSIISNAFFLGLVIAIVGAIIFSSVKPAPLISILVCTIVALRSGSKVRKILLKKNADKEREIQQRLQIEQEASDSVQVLIEVQQPLRTETENPVKITIVNPSDLEVRDISIIAKCNRLVRCDEPDVTIDVVPPGSSGYTAIFVYPRMPDHIDIGKLYVAYLINDNYYEKEPLDIGTYETVTGQQTPVINTQNVTSPLQIERETEFYQGFVRLKMSLNNPSSLVINDVTLEFDFDEHLFRIDRFEPSYSIKNNRLMLGNIQGQNSRSVAVYFDPLLCSKSSEIKCRIFYKDAQGKLLSTEMRPKKIEVTCPILETTSSTNINTGMLRELVESLPFRDSKVYRINSEMDAANLMKICREMIQKHDIRHIRTLKTKDGKNYETWYYGKTKVNGYDIVLKITISEDTESIEIFGATQTGGSLVGMLSEFGRDIFTEINSKKSTENEQAELKQIVNVNIRDSIIQRSNLLNSCDPNGNCSEDVLIEDNIIQRNESRVNFCPSCGAKIVSGANFCSECGTKIM